MDNYYGYYKVAETNTNIGTTISCFYNPITKSEFSQVFTNNSTSDVLETLKSIKINEEVKVEWIRKNATIKVGDTIKIIKANNIVSKVVDKRPRYDRYHRWVGDYVFLENGMKIKITDCILMK